MTPTDERISSTAIALQPKLIPLLEAWRLGPEEGSTPEVSQVVSFPGRLIAICYPTPAPVTRVHRVGKTEQGQHSRQPHTMQSYIEGIYTAPVISEPLEGFPKPLYHSTRA
ncbi:hypothetical protein PM082_023765 [Marasmius tenuissimus]|nr:hypothetical protein PM082_023765 [Marasmius tenuissimus]